MKRSYGLFAIGLLTATAVCPGAVLPAGTPLEVRLSTGVGSGRSHSGDRVRATVIGPAVGENNTMLPRGTEVTGTVSYVRRIGFGLRSSVAKLRLHLDTLQFPDGTSLPLVTRVRKVETAKERVDGSGLIQGVDPRANVSTPTSLLLTSIMSDPAVAVSLMAAKTLLARSPDPEIFLPPGTELVLELTSAANVPDAALPPESMAPLETNDLLIAQQLVSSLPNLQAYKSRKQPSDLINVMLLGEKTQLERAFRAAGWNGEQPHSALALYRMYHCLVQRTGYAMAPMTKLTFNGAISQLNYQKSLNTFAKRHHIRVWKQEDSEVWMAAATEDVGFTFRRFHITHQIDPEIDNERAKVVNDLWSTGCVAAGSLLSGDALQRHQRNNQAAVTDNGIAILRLNDCSGEPTVATAHNRVSPRGFVAIARNAARVATVDLARSNALFSTVGFTRAFIQRTRKETAQSMGAGLASGGAASGAFRTDRWQRRTAMRLAVEQSIAHGSQPPPACSDAAGRMTLDGENESPSR